MSFLFFLFVCLYQQPIHNAYKIELPFLRHRMQIIQLIVHKLWVAKKCQFVFRKIPQNKAKHRPPKTKKKKTKKTKKKKKPTNPEKQNKKKKK